jgi:hypothetical protein
MLKIAMDFIIALWTPNLFMRTCVIQLTGGFLLHFKSYRDR